MKPKKCSPPAPAAHSGGTKRWGSRRWMPWAVALAACLGLAWAYAPTLHAVFLFDDTKQQFALPTASQPLSSWIGQVRPALMFTYWVNSRLSGEDTTWYHVVNLAIHALTGLFVWLALRRLLEWAKVAESHRGLL